GGIESQGDDTHVRERTILGEGKLRLPDARAHTLPQGARQGEHTERYSDHQRWSSSRSSSSSCVLTYTQPECSALASRCVMKCENGVGWLKPNVKSPFLSWTMSPSSSDLQNALTMSHIQL